MLVQVRWPDQDRLVRVALDGSRTKTIATDLAGQTSLLTSTPESEDAPVWSADSRTLYYWDASRPRVMAVDVILVENWLEEFERRP